MRKLFLLIIVAGILAGLFLGYNAPPEAVSYLEPVVSTATPVPEVNRSVSIILPAVDAEGNGAFAQLTVLVKKGSGKVYIGLPGEPVINADTQGSLRISLGIAERESGVSARGLDVFYSISSDSEAVGGKSAGAAATIATIAVLKGERLRSDAVITGTIEPDGSIGPVGHVLEKARAVKQQGYGLFLVPKGEAWQNVSVSECSEQKREVPGGFAVSKSCTQHLEAVSVAKETGLRIIEVSNLSEAYGIMRE